MAGLKPPLQLNAQQQEKYEAVKDIPHLQREFNPIECSYSKQFNPSPLRKKPHEMVFIDHKCPGLRVHLSLVPFSVIFRVWVQNQLRERGKMEQIAQNAGGDSIGIQ